MKVLQIVTAFAPAVVYGGPSTIAAQQANSLARQGHQVTVATSNILNLNPLQHINKSFLDQEGVCVRYFTSKVLRAHFSFIVSIEFSRWLHENIETFDVVHIHFSREWMPVRAAQIALKKGVPTFLQPHGMLGRTQGARKIFDKLWTKKLLETCEAVFVYHQQENNEIAQIAPWARIRRLPNGINAPDFEEKWKAESLLSPIVLFLARLHPRKRVLTFVEMAKLLRDKGMDLRYRIVGDGEELADAQRLADKYNLQNLLTFVGSLSSEEVDREFINSTVYVLPSVNEPFPMSVLRALNFGVPTIVTDTCFIAPILVDNGAALVSCPDSESLANSVERVICNYDVAKQLSENGIKLINDKLTIEAVTQRLEGYYANARA